MNRVVALQPEPVKLVYAHLGYWTCRAPRGRGRDYDIRRTVKNGKTSLA
jgi:hypothetical protein